MNPTTQNKENTQTSRQPEKHRGLALVPCFKWLGINFKLQWYWGCCDRGPRSKKGWASCVRGFGGELCIASPR